MIGNAVPVEFAKRLASKVSQDLKSDANLILKSKAKGKVFHFSELLSQAESA
jgi:hypothetical protein